MKFIQTGQARKDYLKETRTLKILENIEGMFLSKLDYNINFVAKQYPDLSSDYIKNLTRKYEALVENDLIKDSYDELNGIVNQFDNLREKSELVKSSIIDFAFFPHQYENQNLICKNTDQYPIGFIDCHRQVSAHISSMPRMVFQFSSFSA